MEMMRIDKIDGCRPCKYCGNMPVLITKYYEYGDKALEISCETENAICMAFSYMEVENSLEEAIKEWNNQNTNEKTNQTFDVSKQKEDL